MKKIFLLAMLLSTVLFSQAQVKNVYRSKVIYNVTRICHRERTKEGEWNTPYGCKNTSNDLIIKEGRMQMYNDTGKAFTYDFAGPLQSFDDLSLFNTYKDRAMLKAVDQEGKECYIFFISSTDDFYLVIDYDNSASLLYLNNARPLN